MLAGWRDRAENLLARLPVLSPRLAEAQPLLRAWADAAAEGIKVCESLEHGRALREAESRMATEVFQRAVLPQAAVELPIGKPLARLVTVQP